MRAKSKLWLTELTTYYKFTWVTPDQPGEGGMVLLTRPVFHPYVRSAACRSNTPFPACTDLGTLHQTQDGE